MNCEMGCKEICSFCVVVAALLFTTLEKELTRLE